MRAKLTYWILSVVALIACGQTVAYAQADPAAFAVRRHFEVGAGVSNFNMDYGDVRMTGVTAWADFHILGGLPIVGRLAPEVEFRDIPWGSAGSKFNLSQWTFQGGLKGDIYERTRFRIYAKALMGDGTLNFRAGSIPSRPADTSRNDIVYSLGAGVEYRLRPRWTIRGEYEQEWWPNLAYRGSAGAPAGFTGGLGYSF